MSDNRGVSKGSLVPRPLWNGSISFGLVNVPVRLFRAQAPQDVRFHQLHAKDGVRIQQKRVCPADGEEVAYEDIVKGYEIAPEQYVIIEPDDLASLDPKVTHTIDIEDFVDLDEIDPLYYDHGYYITPQDRAEKAYGLLVRAMEETNKVGIARFVMRTKEYLCAVRVREGALVLSTMLFADEVVGTEELELGEVDEPTKKELAMAKQLIESLSGDFQPEQYKDEYREKVLEMIEEKAKGNEIVSQPDAEEPAPVVDLMAALEESLARAQGGKKPSKGASGKKRNTA
jgi:DNA end-binding protein Ku